MQSDPADEFVSDTIPDWTREQVITLKWDPGRRLIRTVRRYQKWNGRGGIIGRLLRKLFIIQNKFWGILCSSELPVTTSIGGGLVIPHPVGIVIHGQARIGVNCMIFHGVTIGSGGAKPGVATIGGHVDIGCGAKVLGGITVGNNARIGANAVVLTDVPPGATAVGVPARIVQSRDDAPGEPGG